MFEAQSMEFPFVASLPLREKSKVRKLWDKFNECRAAAKKHGLLVPQVLAAELCGVSRQRIHTLCNEGRLEVVDLCGTRFVTEKSVIAYAESERGNGRPIAAENMGTAEQWRMAVKVAKEMRAEKSLGKAASVLLAARLDGEK